ncbi:uncharacterized protein LAESUDRAFT_713662 [Laetiporus sulphureus 93-53]|uniref:Uncharacterized protein n=1 Tax=Laetiporus sulphureus 93-53 TaxID=1314785 RepID=A0A165EJ28_9APHY|nr:uncharacterized protein LAESUDRAFT_713662 [Laetiporus sulphureus 93-53]KZT07154.1 hypothetical protein LAESUDRAFT_713662 [Laetiporus sulphureus 93-53]
MAASISEATKKTNDKMQATAIQAARKAYAVAAAAATAHALYIVTTTPQVMAPQVAAPQIAAPQLAAPQITAPQLAAPQVAAPPAAAPPDPLPAPDEPVQDDNAAAEFTDDVAAASSDEDVEDVVPGPPWSWVNARNLAMLMVDVFALDFTSPAEKIQRCGPPRPDLQI